MRESIREDLDSRDFLPSTLSTDTSNRAAIDREYGEREDMVNQFLWNNLQSLIHKEIGSKLHEPPNIWMAGNPADQHQGYGRDLATALIPFASQSYTAQEFIQGRLTFNDDTIFYVDFFAPIVNIKGKSVQGVATFVTSIPHTCAETYVERKVGLMTSNLLPHSLVVGKGLKPKEVSKQGMVQSKAINAVNENPKLRDLLRGSASSTVRPYTLARSHYTIEFPGSDYPGGMFSVVPFHGDTVMIARDAGASDQVVNEPRWGFAARFAAFKGVARSLMKYPEKGETMGKFYMDAPLQALLPPILEGIQRQKMYG